MKHHATRRTFLQHVLGSAALAFLPLRPALAATAGLTAAEIKDLLYMREEEKVARDVYITLFNTWGHPTFDNIAKSEQRHMDTMKKLLDKYGLADPALTAVGAFTNPALQEMYTTLVASGSASLEAALRVGCTIEEVDILDLQHAIDIATHKDLDSAYASLMDGSKNHLRAFVQALEALGIAYVPQYISQEMFDGIVN